MKRLGMNETVMIALIGVLGTLFAPLFAQIVDLKKVGTQYQLDERQKQRQLQREWFMKHYEKQYEKVKNWVLESIQALNMYTNLVQLSEDKNRDERQYLEQYQAFEAMRQRLEVEQVEIVAIAHADVQLARRLDSFDGWLHYPRPAKFWTGDASLVLNRIYEIMGELPNLEANSSKEYDLAENKLKQDSKKRRMLWYACFLIVLVSIAGWWFFMYSR
jgi:hypothetical protein